MTDSASERVRQKLFMAKHMEERSHYRPTVGVMFELTPEIFFAFDQNKVHWTNWINIVSIIGGIWSSRIALCCNPLRGPWALAFDLEAKERLSRFFHNCMASPLFFHMEQVYSSACPRWLNTNGDEFMIPTFHDRWPTQNDASTNSFQTKSPDRVWFTETKKMGNTTQRKKGETLMLNAYRVRDKVDTRLDNLGAWTNDSFRILLYSQMIRELDMQKTHRPESKGLGCIARTDISPESTELVAINADR